MSLPSLYLVTPLLSEAAPFLPKLREALAAVDVASVLLRLAPMDEPAACRLIEEIAALVQASGAALLVEGDPALVGKQTGKDAAAGKATFVSVLGVDGAKARLRELVAEAEAALAPFGQAAAILIEGARFVADRHA